MDNKGEVREFLVSRRARLTPEMVGLPTYGAKRRVPGLKREEVAQLAGVSIDYYTRVERGNLHGVSESVLGSIARALRLEQDEREHLYALARAQVRRVPARRRPPVQVVPDSIRAILDGMVDVPACVVNGRMELVAANRLGRALYAPVFDDAVHVPGHARFVFLNPAARQFWVDWENAATEVVGALRAAAARDPYDKALTDLIGELVTRSPEFRTWWASHDVFVHRGGLKRIAHPAVGRLDLTYDVLTLPQHPDLSIVAYTAPAGSPSHDGLRMLATWAATLDQKESVAPVAPEH
ncbi:helix-turn-helix transcriptional regulator [Cellulomonas sp. 179-A 4D5 NHS]|uniref:helix-turn-helix transcriptional regulator n=1 Tax=Cellulomonas sp. 179-A 4D5 NHS TaxID=3142378 RepID=UPI00399F645F